MKDTIIKEAEEDFNHFLMCVHGLTKQNEPEEVQKCINEATAWFKTTITTAYNSRQSEIDAAREEEHQFFLNILDGIDVADKEMGAEQSNTQAIRFALKSRTLSATETPNI